jgi:hypothetical protein
MRSADGEVVASLEVLPRLPSGRFAGMGEQPCRAGAGRQIPVNRRERPGDAANRRMGAQRGDERAMGEGCRARGVLEAVGAGANPPSVIQAPDLPAQAVDRGDRARRVCQPRMEARAVAAADRPDLAEFVEAASVVRRATRPILAAMLGEDGLARAVRPGTPSGSAADSRAA